MSADKLHELADLWEKNEGVRADLSSDLKYAKEAIVYLKKRIAELEEEAKETPDFLFADDFATRPEDALDRWVVDRPPTAFFLRSDPVRCLETRLDFTDELNHAGKAKAELGPRLGERAERYGRIPFGVERWHAVTMTIPPDWKEDGHKVSVIDFHGSEDAEERGIGRNASLGVHIGRKDIYGWKSWSDKPIQEANENREEIFRFAYERGVPYRFIFKTVFDWGRNGVGETMIWAVQSDIRTTLYNDRGPNAFNDKEGPYFKFGVYVPSWNRTEREKYLFTAIHRELWWNRVRVGGPGTKLEDMA